MSASKLAARYAKSLLDLASEKNQLDQVNNDIRYFSEVVKQNKDFVLMLKNPIIFSDKKQKIIDLVFGNFTAMTKEFLRIVISKRREEFLPEFAQSFIEQYNKQKSITPVKVTTAVPIDAALIEQITALLKKDISVGKVEIQSKVDESIIGGFILNYEDKMFDASVARSLEVIDDNFLDNSYIKKF